MKAVVAAFNQEKALVGAFSVITTLRMELFEALMHSSTTWPRLNAVVMKRFQNAAGGGLSLVTSHQSSLLFTIIQCGLWRGFTDASLRCSNSGDRWEDDTPVCSSPQSDLIILCRNTDPKLCEVIFIADIQKLFHFLWYIRVALADTYLQLSISPFRDKSVQVHSYNLNLSLPICHSPKIYYLSNIYQILSHSFCSFWPMILTKESIYLSQDVQ